jgi:TRAP-type C4-dicarboxylate transport system substrate-binding protein
MLDSVILGNLDICKTSTGIISTIVPEFGVFDLPYVFRDLNHMMATTKSKVGQDLAAKLEARNVKILFWMEQGTRSFYTTGKPIRTPDDLKGMKIRTISSPVMADTINALGATATPMGFGDLYLGLKSGVVDGAENARMRFGIRSSTKSRNIFRSPITFVLRSWSS